jgi:hypothetical protein
LDKRKKERSDKEKILGKTIIIFQRPPVRQEKGCEGKTEGGW